MKAYHQVRTADHVDAILADGAILPVIHFIHPSQIDAMCKDFRRAFQSRHSTEPQKTVSHAFDSIVEDVIEAIRDRQLRAGISPVGLPWKRAEGIDLPATNLQCEDILAGDIDLVFLSAGNWMDSGRVSGFVFDADDLVRRGARLRPQDFLAPFIRHIERSLLRKDWPSAAAAKAEIERGLAEIVERDEVEGAAALKLLREWGAMDPRRLRVLGPEIVWQGPLPVDLAVEVWKNGWSMEEGR